MTSQTDYCFTRLLLRKYPLITEDTIDCLISNGFRDEELLLLMDVDTDLPVLPISMAQELALKKVLLKIQSMAQKSFDDTLNENFLEDINEIRTQLANNSSTTEPLVVPSTPQPSPTPPSTTTAMVISSDESDSESPQRSSTSWRSCRSLLPIPSTSGPSNPTTGGRSRITTRVQSRSGDQSGDTEVEDSNGGHQRTHSLCPRECSVVLTRVLNTSTGAPIGGETSGNNCRKRFACVWPGCEFKTHWKPSLTTHRLKHLPAKQSKCYYNDCHKSYANNKNLKRHIMAEHLNVRFVCNYRKCGKIFKYSTNSADHKKRFHHK
jgi:hypothetical protein